MACTPSQTSSDARERPAAPAAFVDRLVQALPCFEGALVPLLQGVQREYGYLPREALLRLAEKTPFSAAQIEGAATFYAQFRLRPAGRHTIKVCIGTACHVKGAPRVIDAFKRHLRIDPDEDTDKEGAFTVEGVACLGCCMLAPAVQIDDLVYGPVTPQNVDNVLADFLSELNRHEETVSAQAPPVPRGEMRLCQCSSCRAAGADKVADGARRVIHAYRLPVEIKDVACTGVSFETPLVEIVLADGKGVHRYGCVKQSAIGNLLLRHFQPARLSARVKSRVEQTLDWIYRGRQGEPITRYLLTGTRDIAGGFAKRQVRIATEHCGELPPLDLDAYRAKDGFKALTLCRDRLSPEEIIAVVEESGLRGRGGAGYPTGLKWGQVKAAPGVEKYLVANADEGDPGAFMDRMMLESFPFRVIEGIAIAARALDIGRGFVYVRAEYPLAVDRLRQAIARCEREGILAPSPGEDDDALHLEVVEGAGAFVCGEETALIAAVEGGRGTPRLRPPYPARRGLWGNPTLVNNVETFSLVPWILRHGAAAFAALGTPSSRGTKTFALAGKIRRGGLVEVPMGMTIREIVEEIGGGVESGRTLKAVQIGGPSGGCVPASLVDTPVDYSALNAVDAMMGSGGLVVLDDSDCMVDVARYFMTFIQQESCGKCTCCRVGTWEMLDILERLCAGKGRKADIENLRALGETVRHGSLCGLGGTAPNPVLSTLRHFAEEYQAHVEGRCPARNCRELIVFRISERCIGCTRCAQICPTKAIAPTPYRQHVVDDERCVQCGACRDACPVDAVDIVDRFQPSHLPPERKN